MGSKRDAMRDRKHFLRTSSSMIGRKSLTRRLSGVFGTRMRVPVFHWSGGIFMIQNVCRGIQTNLRISSPQCLSMLIDRPEGPGAVFPFFDVMRFWKSSNW